MAASVASINTSGAVTEYFHKGLMVSYHKQVITTLSEVAGLLKTPGDG
jgi:hypothetical protein